MRDGKGKDGVRKQFGEKGMHRRGKIRNDIRNIKFTNTALFIVRSEGRELISRMTANFGIPNDKC